ncbi:MAG: hypothetical protein NXI24_03675 [bacterium]|nr:hypothetical protein [bacterium]
MKRTEMERIERELRRSEKKVERIQGEGAGGSVGSYIERLFGLFRYDQSEIFNTAESLEILELLEQMKEDIPEKKWPDVLKKAIKKTQVAQKDKAMEELKELIGLN